MKPQIKTIWRREWYGHEENPYCVVEPCDICGKIVRPSYRSKCHYIPSRSQVLNGWPVVYYEELCSKCAVSVRAVVRKLKELKQLDRLVKVLGAPSEIAGIKSRIRVSDGFYIDAIE